MDTTVAKAIIQSQVQLYPAKLVVELTEERSPKDYPDTMLIPLTGVHRTWYANFMMMLVLPELTISEYPKFCH